MRVSAYIMENEHYGVSNFEELYVNFLLKFGFCLLIDLQIKCPGTPGHGSLLHENTAGENLQSENEIEWSKREQLESEMMNLERINKQLKSELNDTLEKLQKQSKPESSSDIKYRLLQQELADKNIVSFLLLFIDL